MEPKSTDWILTRSGKKAYPLEMDPDMVCLEDVAHALSLVCRWSGHCKQHYSVALHALLVAELVHLRHHDSKTTLLALHHDSHEAYLGDTARPVKRYCSAEIDGGIWSWRYIEDRCQRSVDQALMPGLCWTDEQYAQVKAADDAFLYYEWQMLMPKSEHGDAFEVHAVHQMTDAERTHITTVLGYITNPARTFELMHKSLMAEVKSCNS